VRVARREWDALYPLAIPYLSRLLSCSAALGRGLAPRDPLPPLEGRAARRGQLVTALLALAFVLFFSAYLFAQHDAYQTHAEDMGIMTQALWNTAHGAALHQTICDPVGDTNCLGDVSRLAIHFEPILFLLAPIYALFPSPKTLQLVQALGVAAGALPAFWLASRRLRSAAAGVLFAVLYLLYPPLDAALTFDFHAVTLAAPLLLYALYFLLTRHSRAFLIAATLALGTKEEIALTVAMLGLYAMIVQRRRRFGGGVVLFALGWILMEVLVMHTASPLGHSPMTSRYATFGASPQAILVGVLTHPELVRAYLLQPERLTYLGALLGPLAFLGLASPVALLLAAPAIGLNMLSSQSVMYSGQAQYSAEIAPLMLLAAVDGAGKLATLGDRLAAWLIARLRSLCDGVSASRLSRIGISAGLHAVAQRLEESLEESPTLPSLVVATAVGLAAALRAAAVERWGTFKARVGLASWFPPARDWWSRALDSGGRRAFVSAGPVVLLAIVLLPAAAELGAQQRAAYLPFGRSFVWPQSSAHVRLADTLVARIPPAASVTAQSDLAPHLSNRRRVYLFPDQALAADYVLLDVTGNIFPYDDPRPYVAQVRAVLGSGLYRLAAAQDGYLLLQRATAALAVGGGAPTVGKPADSIVDPAHLPQPFYTFTQPAAPVAIAHRLRGVSFTDGGAVIQLLGYDLSPSPALDLDNPILTVTTYWRVTGQLGEAVSPELQVDYPSDYSASFTGFPTTDWLPVAAWPSGTTMVVRSEPLALSRKEPGTVKIGVRLRTATGDGALRARVRAFAPGMLRAQVLPSADARAPGERAVLGESGTLVSFAQECVTL
jgi:uncharacterized membrane protein